MALKSFIKTDSYTRINRISIHKENDQVDFEISVYNSVGGEKIFGPLYFSLRHSEELEKYKKENLTLPSAPEYPILCSTREAMVPMWTEVGTSEEAAYDEAKASYDQAVKTYNDDCATVTQTMEITAETENEFTKHFSDQKIYIDSNVTACAYEFLKSLPGFEAVKDA